MCFENRSRLPELWKKMESVFRTRNTPLMRIAQAVPGFIAITRQVSPT